MSSHKFLRLLLSQAATLKYYTIRTGKKIGIFNSRTEVQPLVTGFPAAKYKSFPTREEAEKAFQQGREYYYQPKQKPNLWKSRATLPEIPFIKESIAVDAACSGNPGVLEYRGVDLQTGQEIFHQHFEIGTNNIGEFLAIAHGVAYVSDKPLKTIYTDSKTALSRVKQGICKSKFRDTNPERAVRYAVTQAEQRLKKNGVSSTLLKRNTEDRGEIPADFGRK